MKKLEHIFTVFCVSLISTIATAQAPKDSLVLLPWNGSISYERSTGSCLSLESAALERTVQSDLMNRLTGLVPGLEITENAGFGLPNYHYRTLDSDQFNVRMRGRGNVVCIVNDVCIPFGQLSLEPNQIESITFLTDVADRARYGALASDGALLIKTKGGDYNTPMRINLDLECGVSMADRVPEWVGGADYALLNNAARTASCSYQPQFTQYAIRRIAAGDPYDERYPNVDYKSLMFKNSLPISRAALDISGGGSGVRYNFSFSGLYSSDVVKATTPVDWSKFNFTAGLGVKVGRYIELSADFSSMLYFRRYARTNWYDYRSVPATAYPLEMTSSDGNRIYGVSAQFPQNYYALLQEGGFRTNRMRSGLVNVAMDIDLSILTPGLKSRTLISSSVFSQTTIGKDDDYIGYYWVRYDGFGQMSTHKGVKASGKSTFATFTFQNLSLYERLSYDRTFGRHALLAGATFTMGSASTKDDAYNQRQLYTVLDLNYSYDKRYTVEFVGLYAGSSRYSRENRFAFFPSGGASWTVSNEAFMQSCKKWLNRLKIRSQVGMNGQTDVFGTPYQYRADYSYNGDMWFGPIGTQSSYFGTERWVAYKTTINRMENSGLTWPKIFQADLGLDFDFLDMFSLNVSAYYKRMYDIIVDVSSVTPGVYGTNGVTLVDNYTALKLKGLDVSLSFFRTFGDFRLGAAFNASSFKCVNDIVLEDNVLYDYQKKSGKASDAYWGYRCIGRYTEENLDSYPALTTAIKPGDLIYEDVNNDGILDSNDKVVLGNTSPRFIYSVNLRFGWKNLELDIVGTGRSGYSIPMTNAWFWNGWGDGNYSTFVRDNLGGAYPRLDYVYSDQNFTASDFWLRDGSWFKIQNVELSYNLKLKNVKWMEGIRFSIRGGNLLTLSAIKDVDPENINAGVTAYPLFRSVTGGIKLMF